MKPEIEPCIRQVMYPLSVSVCVCVCVCVLKYISARKSTVDGSQPSLWNSIAFNSVAIFSVNCFGLEPISAAEFLEALKAKTSEYLSHTIYTHIFHKQ